MSNFSWSFFSEIVGKGAYFVTNIYLARILQVENFGLFVLAQTIVAYFWLSVDLGINMYGIREIAKGVIDRTEIIGELLAIRIISGVVVFSIFTFIVLFVLNIPSIEKLSFIGCGLYLITYALYIDWIFRGVEKFKYIAYGKILSSIVYLSGIFIFIKTSVDVALAAFIYSISFLGGAIFLNVILIKRLKIKFKFSFSLNKWRIHLKESIYFTLSGVINMSLYSMPVIIIGLLLTNYDIGLFSAPYRIINSLCSVGVLIPMAFYPVFSASINNDINGYYKTQMLLFVVMTILGLFFCLTGLIWGDRFINILYGSAYNSSVVVFKILVVMLLFSFIRPSFGLPLLSMGYQKWSAFSGLISLMLFLFLSIILIPKYNIVGAALAITTAECINVTILAVIFLHVKNVKTPLYDN